MPSPRISQPLAIQPLFAKEATRDRSLDCRSSPLARISPALNSPSAPCSYSSRIPSRHELPAQCRQSPDLGLRLSFVLENNVVPRAKPTIWPRAHDGRDRFLRLGSMLNSEGRAKWIDGSSVRIDFQVDVTRIMLRFDHLLDITLGGGRIAVKHAAGLIPDDLDSILGIGGRQKSGLKPPDPGCARRDQHRKHTNY